MIQRKALKYVVCCLTASVVLLGCSSKYKPVEVYTSSQEENQEMGESGQTQPEQPSIEETEKEGEESSGGKRDGRWRTREREDVGAVAAGIYRLSGQRIG